MVFADVFESCQFPDYAASGGYLKYRQLARTVRRLKHAGDPATPQLLLAQVKEDAARVATWIRERVENVRRIADQLRRACKDGSMDRVAARENATAVRHETLRLHEARCLNADALIRVADRFRSYTLLPPPPVWQWVRDGAGLLDEPLDHVWYCLSAAYAYARGDDAGHSKVAQADSGSQDFVRRSVKYWVHIQDMPFVVGRIVEHLPLSMMKDLYKGPEAPYAIGSAISSVYFDNPNFTMYHRRMRRLEGSSLFRVRWYGDEADIADPDLEVFAELKVHHEAWSGEASTKRRFQLKNRDVDAFLEGELSLNGHVEDLVRRGAKPKDIAKFQGLAVEMLTTIVTEGLRPALRTEYSRCAFQRGKDQSVRVSIDTNLRMRAEDLGASKHWRSDGESVDPRHKIDFPYAVVEVKLQCAENQRVPAWVEELMACRFMESVPKFSKYAHGVSSLFGSSRRIKLTPYWLHQVDTDIRAATKVDSAAFDAVRGLADPLAQRLIDRAIFGKSAPQAARTAALAEPIPSRSSHVHAFVKLDKGADATPSHLEIAAAGLPLHLRHREYDARKTWAVTAMDLANVEAGCCSGVGGPSSEPAFGDIPGQTAKRVKVPQRFDPKTFFTAERYFLRWAESSTMLALGALFILQFGDVGTLPLFGPWYGTRVHVALGVIMMGVALMALTYSLIQFHARSRRVYARVKIRYDDEWGPSALTGATIGGLLVLAFIHVTERFGHMQLF